MSKKQLTTISTAALATLGAFAASVGSASALPPISGSIPNPNGKMPPGTVASKPSPGKRIHIHVHRYRRVVYAAPVYVAAVPACHYERRPAGLFRVCRVR